MDHLAQEFYQNFFRAMELVLREETGWIDDRTIASLGVPCMLNSGIGPRFKDCAMVKPGLVSIIMFPYSCEVPAAGGTGRSGFYIS